MELRLGVTVSRGNLQRLVGDVLPGTYVPNPVGVLHGPGDLVFHGAPVGMVHQPSLIDEWLLPLAVLPVSNLGMEAPTVVGHVTLTQGGSVVASVSLPDPITIPPSHNPGGASSLSGNLSERVTLHPILCGPVPPARYRVHVGLEGDDSDAEVSWPLRLGEDPPVLGGLGHSRSYAPGDLPFITVYFNDLIDTVGVVQDEPSVKGCERRVPGQTGILGCVPGLAPGIGGPGPMLGRAWADDEEVRWGPIHHQAGPVGTEPNPPNGPSMGTL